MSEFYLFISVVKINKEKAFEKAMTRILLLIELMIPFKYTRSLLLKKLFIMELHVQKQSYKWIEIACNKIILIKENIRESLLTRTKFWLSCAVKLAQVNTKLILYHFDHFLVH